MLYYPKVIVPYQVTDPELLFETEAVASELLGSLIDLYPGLLITSGGVDFSDQLDVLSDGFFIVVPGNVEILHHLMARQGFLAVHHHKATLSHLPMSHHPILP